MDCQEIKKYLYPFIDGELDRKRSLKVQAHLDSCPLCGLEFESEKKIESVINEKILRDKAPLALRERVIEQIELAEARSSFRSSGQFCLAGLLCFITLTEAIL